MLLGQGAFGLARHPAGRGGDAPVLARWRGWSDGGGLEGLGLAQRVLRVSFRRGVDLYLARDRILFSVGTGRVCERRPPGGVRSGLGEVGLFVRPNLAVDLSQVGELLSFLLRQGSLAARLPATL